MQLKGKLPKRKSGILLALSSLPSNYGIGTLGREAYKFIDFLAETNQKYWQMLPLVPLGEGNSPYKSPSCFAGEILYIDLDMLVKDGFLEQSDLTNDTVFPQKTDFELVKKYKLPLIKKATENLSENNEDYIKFCNENKDWLEPYAVFMTATEVFNTDYLPDFPQFIKNRQGEEYEEFLKKNADIICFYKKAQFFFYSQYFKLKNYAKNKGIMLIGDIPFYVSPDSADVLNNKENFMVDEGLKPNLVAGVPPDLFSSTGQLWGNPIYDWEYLKSTNYKWWTERLKHYFKIFDVIRVDHFRAFADYYVIDADKTDATSGKWVLGAGIGFWETALKEIPDMLIIAEDLGGETGLVKELVKETGFPNMKVLQFAFSGDPNNPHLPENYPENCVCYTGTHDNNTTLGFLDNALDCEKEMINRLYPETDELTRPLNLIKAAMESKADTVIIPMQDYLLLDENSRMNTPGTPSGNWSFRLFQNYIDGELIKRVQKIARK